MLLIVFETEMLGIDGVKTDSPLAIPAQPPKAVKPIEWHTPALKKR